MTPPPPNTAVPPRSSKKTRLREYLERTTPPVIAEREWGDLLRELHPISESYLRRLLHDCGVRVEQPWAGIRQADFEELQKSLEAMGECYAAAPPERARYCRRVVIQAKDHARLALRKLEGERRTRKEEMIRWMLVWLENPSVFPSWVRLRKRAIESESS